MQRSWRSGLVGGRLLAVVGLTLTWGFGCAAPQPREKPVSERSADRSPAPQSPADPTPETTLASDEVLVQLGESVNGQPLQMHIFGPPEGTLFIFAGIHGDEPTSISLAIDLIYHLRKNPEITARHPVAVFPIANPDGFDARTRQNANGVDCNRNFPATNWEVDEERGRYWGGPAPASEPETRAVIKAVEMLQPRAIISIHSISGQRQQNNYDGPAEWLADLLGNHNGYPTTATIGYATPGSFGSWAGKDLQIPTVTLELPASAPAAVAWETNRDALVAAIQSAPPMEVTDRR